MQIELLLRKQKFCFFVEKNSTNKKIKKAHSICIRNLITKKETDQYEKN